jgi:hypothetical protein
MARGGRSGKKRTQYVRDAQGQFASTPGGGKKATPSAVRKAAKAAALKGGTLAARTSLKKSRTKLAGIDKADQTLQTSLSKRAQKGAVTRGRKKLAKAIEANQTRLIGVKPNANTIKKKRSPILEAKPLQKPASQRPGSMTATLRGALKSLAQADAQRIREIESITGQKIKPIKERAATVAGERVRSTARGGKVADTLRAGLRELAQSDARTMREMSQIVKDATPKVAGGKGQGRVKGPAKPKVMVEAQKPSGKVYRTRKQSAAMQKNRARRLMEGAGMAAGADEMLARPGSLRVRYGSSQQQNIFGGVDKVRHKKAFEHSNTSVIGMSKSKEREARGIARVNKASTRLASLNNQRNAIIGKMTGNDFRKTSAAQKKLNKLNKSIKAVYNAMKYYESSRNAQFKKTAKKPK